MLRGFRGCKVSKRRAAKHQVNVRLRPDGRWEARFYLTEPDGIRRRRVSVYASTQAEAVARAQEYLVQHRRGLVPKPDRRTLQSFALEVLERITKGKSPNTARNYRRELTLILEHLGHLPIQKVTPRDIRRALDVLSERYHRRTVGKALERLRMVYREALLLEVVHRDPTGAVVLPRSGEREAAGKHLEPHQVRLLLEYAEASRSPVMALFLRLLVQLGLRKGEALGLQWRDVDFHTATLRLERQYTLQGNRAALGPLKTKAARRVIPIPQDLLARLKAKHDGLVSEGFQAKDLQQAFVFGLDKPLDVNAPNHYLRRLIGRIRLEHPDFPQVTIHGLRHTAASLLLARGLDLALVGEKLGHANPGVTLQVYRHLLQEERQAGALPLEELLGGVKHRA